MHSICNYTGPSYNWSLPLNGSLQSVFFPSVTGCCISIQGTNFPQSADAFLNLLFEQIGANNETITRFTRRLQKPKKYTALSGSQVTLQVQSAYNQNASITGTQQYINCSDEKNRVNSHKKHSIGGFEILSISLACALVVGFLLGGCLYFCKKPSRPGYVGI